MKRIHLTAIVVLLWLPGWAQQAESVQLQDCLNAVENNFPLGAQRQLIDSSLSLSIQNLNKNYLPKIDIEGQATYQSDVASIPVDLPFLQIPQVPKDQYKAQLGLTQTIYDGGATSHLKDMQTASAGVDKQQVEVQLYDIKKKVAQLYLNIMLLHAERNLLSSTGATLSAEYSRLEGAESGGVALPSDVDLIQAEKLRNTQQQRSIAMQLVSNAQAISTLTGLPVDTTTSFSTPQFSVNYSSFDVSKRPEYKLFDDQNKLVESRKAAFNSRNIPKLGAFAQAGYGRPGLNPLATDFNSFYILGAKLSWNIWDWRTTKTDKEIASIDQAKIEKARESFVKQSTVEMQQLNDQISDLEQQMETDGQIVNLRQKVAATKSFQLEKGIITSSEYVTAVNAQQQAQINYELHKIQWIQARINLSLAQGNL